MLKGEAKKAYQREYMRNYMRIRRLQGRLLRPSTSRTVKTPASEQWLWENPEALDLVKRGLDDAANGKVSRVEIDADGTAIYED